MVFGMNMGTMIMIAFCKTGEVSPALILIPPGFRASLQFLRRLHGVHWHTCCLSSNTNKQLHYYHQRDCAVPMSIRDKAASCGAAKVCRCLDAALRKNGSAGRRNTEPHNRVNVLQPYRDDAEWGIYLRGAEADVPETAECRIERIALQTSMRLLETLRAL
jgi:hypothetical protein